MEFELIVFLVMLGVFLLGNFLLKLPVSLSMAAGAIGGALVAGEGIPLRHLFEGTFVYMDTILIISIFPALAHSDRHFSRSVAVCNVIPVDFRLVS